MENNDLNLCPYENERTISIKECLKDNKITTFNQLKKFYQSDKLEAYENIKGIKMPKIENYK